MSTMIPLEKFICYKDPNGKYKVTCTDESENESELIFDGIYKLTLIKPYTENGKNPEMELVLDGSTKYNISYIMEDYDLETDEPIYVINTLENVSFNEIFNESSIHFGYFSRPDIIPFEKSILDQYTQCFDQGFYHKNAKEVYYVEPYETDDQIFSIYNISNHKIRGYFCDPFYITNKVSTLELKIRANQGGYDCSINSNKYIKKILKYKDIDFGTYLFMFGAKKDDDDNIIWQSVYSITEYGDYDPKFSSLSIVDTADFGITIV